MNKFTLSESAIHYATGFLMRYVEQYPTKKHADSLKNLRDLSNMLLESLEQPVSLNIIRHNLKK